MTRSKFFLSVLLASGCSFHPGVTTVREEGAISTVVIPPAPPRPHVSANADTTIARAALAHQYIELRIEIDAATDCSDLPKLDAISRSGVFPLELRQRADTAAEQIRTQSYNNAISTMASAQTLANSHNNLNSVRLKLGQAQSAFACAVKDEPYIDTRGSLANKAPDIVPLGATVQRPMQQGPR